MVATKSTSHADKAVLRGETLPKEEASAVVMAEQNGLLINDKAYFEVLNSIKKQIRDAQYRAVLGVNQQQILLYWNIGKTISANVRYGNKFVENLARDIKTEFPNSTGYSVRNLKYMNRFARFVDDFQIVQTLSAQLTWSHSVLKDIHKPIGVTEYKLSDFVPAEFADTLPSAEDIEKRILSQYSTDLKDSN